MNNFGEKTQTHIPTPSKLEDLDNDWGTPFTHQDLQAIDAAILSASSSTDKTPSVHTQHDMDHARPKTRRRSARIDSGQISASFAPVACPSNNPFPPQVSVTKEYPAMCFEGQIVYNRTSIEVDKAALQIFKSLESKKRETGHCVVGLDIEWKPTFRRGVAQNKAAVMQICGDMSHCFVLHIIHSGIPKCLRSLLEDSTFIKVGVGIANDADKVLRDYNVSIKSVEDLSNLANEKLGGEPKRWSLSSLVETVASKKLLKPKKIRLGNWETKVLSNAQLQYAATDAFASWHVYEVLKSLPDVSEAQD